ncbi:MAG TPA: hypothetical protein VGK74_26925 [Symbiobacteriaceae bacterium]|jgi:hypothetical protein
MDYPESASGFTGFEGEAASFYGAFPGGAGAEGFPGAQSMVWGGGGATGFPGGTAGAYGMPGAGNFGFPGAGVSGMGVQRAGGFGKYVAQGVAPYWSNLLIRSLQLIESALPAQEVIHSLVAQTMTEPQLRDLPAVQRVAETQRAHLSDMAAVAGYIRRLLTGDASAPVVSGLQQAVQSLQQSHMECRAALQQLAAAEPARASDVVRSIAQVSAIADQAGRTAIAAVQPLVMGQAGLAGQTGFTDQAGFTGQAGFTDQAGFTGQAGFTDQAGFTGQTGFTDQAGGLTSGDITP